MKVLVVEDEFVSRIALQEMLLPYGTVHAAVNGTEAIRAVQLALKEQAAYDLICMDVLMPVQGGQQALRGIRALEESRGMGPDAAVKVVLTTALKVDEDVGKVGRKLLEDMRCRCDGYLVKPIKKAALVRILRRLDLID